MKKKFSLALSIDRVGTILCWINKDVSFRSIIILLTSVIDNVVARRNVENKNLRREKYYINLFVNFENI